MLLHREPVDTGVNPFDSPTMLLIATNLLAGLR